MNVLLLLINEFKKKRSLLQNKKKLIKIQQKKWLKLKKQQNNNRNKVNKRRQMKNLVAEALKAVKNRSNQINMFKNEKQNQILNTFLKMYHFTRLKIFIRHFSHQVMNLTLLMLSFIIC